MKKSFLYLIVFSFFGLVSCGSDDDGDSFSAASGTVTLDGNSYKLTNGYFTDYGFEDNHYNVDFDVADGSINFEDDSFNSTIYIYAELFSPSTDEFVLGTFEYLDYLEDPTNDQFYFNNASVTLDDDGNISFDDNPDYRAIGGTIVVSGSKSNYTLTYNLEFPNNVTLEGSVSGSFTGF